MNPWNSFTLAAHVPLKMSEQGKPYVGSKQRLVLSLDIGTTYSGVAYCILTPGEVPKIHSVTRYVRNALYAL